MTSPIPAQALVALMVPVVLVVLVVPVVLVVLVAETTTSRFRRSYPDCGSDRVRYLLGARKRFALLVTFASDKGGKFLV